MSITKPDDLDALRTILNALEPFDISDKERIVRWTLEKLGIDTPHTARTFNQTTNSAEGNSGLNLSNSRGSQDIKSFIVSKNPQSDNQLSAVVAYYYKFVSPFKKDAINKEDILNACRLAGITRPKRPEQTLINAHSTGLLDKGTEKGTYEINSVGENLVAVSLPSSSIIPVNKRKVSSVKKAKAKKT